MADFNPRSREGSDAPQKCEDVLHLISIRAPARGATQAFICYITCLVISIRAPARGATRDVGGFSDIQNISIRAPARGATLLCLSCHLSSEFQSALPRGERLLGSSICTQLVKFQSALPRGERLPDAGRVLNYRGISIRAPARGATLTHWSQLTSYKFQSALPRGERLLNGGSIDNPDFISIRAPARGATRKMKIVRI